MTVFARWSIVATHRLHGLTEGPCTPCTARYDLADGGTAVVPLELPLGPPATAGRTVLMLPAPPADSLVVGAVLFAGDGTELMEIRCDPPEGAGDSGTWQVAVTAPGLDASSFMDAPQDVVLHIGGREYPCDVLRDPGQDGNGIAAWLVVPREPLPPDTEGMTATAGTMPAGITLILCPNAEEGTDD